MPWAGSFVLEMKEYIIFTDESSITDSRFHCLSAFSFEKSSYNFVNDSLKTLLLESKVEEFKWNKLKDAKYFFCAEKIIRFVLNNISKINLRIDTLVWDTHDKRHKVQRRDDLANYERMFFHLLHNSLKKRSKDSRWSIHPDKRGGINWQVVHDCLHHKGKMTEFENLIFGSFLTDPHYSIADFQERHSHEEISIQIPDLFSGLSVFSRTNYDRFKKHRESKIPSLFEKKEPDILSNRESFRFQLLDLFNKECKNRKIGVSLDTNGYLYTFKPENPLNFWHYEPQGDYDRAPQKNQREEK